MAGQFYLGGPDSDYGPFDVDRLKGLIEAGQLRPGDLVREDFSDQWRPAQSFSVLAECFAAITASPPFVSDADQPHFETAGRRGAHYGDADAFGDEPAISIENRELNRALILRFRREIHALGAFWIIIGSLALGFALLGGMNQLPGPGPAGKGPKQDEFTLLAAFIGLMGLMWILVGIFACLKKIAAVYVGLVLSYLSLVGNLINLNVCGVIILIVVIFQGHRVLTWANKMIRAEVPLDVQP